MFFVFFFFSSRRRHTRFDCDWSSDVCSSDLGRFDATIDLNPDYVYESRGRLTDWGYEVEVRIPLKSLRYQSADPQDWGLQIVRVVRSEEHTSELQSQSNLVCRLLLEKKKKNAHTKYVILELRA